MSDVRLYLTPAQLGERYQVSSDTILRWYRAGKIPAEVATGAVYRFDPVAVAEALKADADRKQRSRL